MARRGPSCLFCPSSLDLLGNNERASDIPEPVNSSFIIHIHHSLQVTAAQLAHLLNAALEGDPNATVSRPARIEEAGPGDLSFFDNPKYEAHAYTTGASVLLVHKDFKPSQSIAATLLRVDDVRSSLAVLLAQFQSQMTAAAAQISERASIHASVKLGENVSVGDFAVIEEGAVIGVGTVIAPQVFVGKNVRIGAGCHLFPGVRVHFDCMLGDHCVLHANAVIGSDGFGFAPQPDGAWKKVPQVGNVVLEHRVEIGANTCIDRAALGSTLIREGAKIDNLVHIAHNVEIGRNTALAAQVGIAGSARIGAQCIFGGQVGIAGHLHIADGTKLQAQSGVGSNIKEANQAFFGSPAIPYNDYVRAYVVFKQLPELQRKVRALEKKI